MSGLIGVLGGPIKGLVGTIGSVIDSLTTTTEEKLKAKNELAQLHASFLIQMEAASNEFAKAQASVIIAEANGESWLQKSWRPCLMFTFMFIIAWNYIFQPIVNAFLPVPLPVLALPPEMWELLKIGMGGYIVGRSGEYIAESWAEGQKAKASSK